MLRNTLSAPTGEEEQINAMLMESLDELDSITSKLQKTVDELEPGDVPPGVALPDDESGALNPPETKS